MSNTYTPPSIHSPDQEPINLTSETTIPNEEDDFFINSVMKRKDTEIRTSLVNSLKKLQVFPVFGDKDMAKISINYFLYLEFFQTAIRMFISIFVFSFISFFIYMFVGMFFSPEVAYKVRLVLNPFNGVIAVFLLKRVRRQEDERILNEDMLYNLQWSEDQFSVLVEGLPFDVTQDEITFFFKSVLAEEQQICRIVDVMFIHNYKTLVPRKNELAMLQKKQKKYETKGGDPNKVSKVNERIKVLEQEISQYTQEITQNKYFGGKAIVIFETVQSQNDVLRFFTYGNIKSLIISLFPSKFKKHYLRNYRISVREIAEPRDVMFENLHYSSSERSLRLFFTYIISFLIVAAAIATVYFTEGPDKDTVKKLIDSKFTAYASAVFTMLLAITLERLFLATQKIQAHTSTIEAKRGLMTYCLYVSFFLYCGLQMPQGVYDMEFFVRQILRISMLFAGKSIIFKLIAIYSSTKVVGHVSQHTSNNLLTTVATKAKSLYEEFDFAKGIAVTYPPLLIGTSFFCADPLFILPPMIIILYVFAALDKYRLIKGSNLIISKSASFMLRPFNIYRYIPLIGFTYNLGLLNHGDMDKFEGVYRILLFVAYWVGYVGYFASCCCPKPLHERVREKFVEKNALVKHGDVCHEFSSVFRKQDPYHQNNLTKNQKI